MRGRTYASMTVVVVRSYSRYSPETWCESESSPSKPASRSASAAASSWAGFAYACRNAIATLVDALLREDRRRVSDVVEVDRGANGAVEVHPLGDGDPQPARDERRRMLPEEVVRVVPVAAADLEDVAEPAGREQPDDGAGAGRAAS